MSVEGSGGFRGAVPPGGSGTNKEVLPYGSWPTPITSELIVGGARVPNGLQVDRATGELWWSEGRPEEGGRTAVLRLGPDGEQIEVLPSPWNARSGVHEYGGGAWWVRDGVLWFVEWATQRLHRLAPGDDEPVPLTPESVVPRGLRYADGDVSPDGRWILCVQEEHHADGSEATNTIVRLAAHAPSVPEVVVEGPDFVSDPRWRADGEAFCWLEWDHPDMPWDATRLVVDEGGGRTVVAGADQRESICQPTWADDGSLWFTADRTGFWSLHRWTVDGGVDVVVDLDLDIGEPKWVFGQRCFALRPDGSLIVVRHRNGTQGLVEVSDAGRSTAFEGYTSIDWVQPQGMDLAFVAGSAFEELCVVRVTARDEGRLGSARAVVPPRDLGLDVGWSPFPEHLTFPTAGGRKAHALYYPPTNPEYQGPADEKPPLLVLIHGGPTAAARPILQLSRCYWTSRGFAVVDVNYRGSTGYGRAYRDLLKGQWGIADVEDCVAVVEHLVREGRVDPSRACIRGGSAGGFTVLAAMAFHDVFAAGASHYGVADLSALAQETHKFESRYCDSLVAPWPEGRAVYEERSPIHHLDGIDKPLAVFQGSEDAIVPPNQAEMIVDGLRSRGVPVAYMLFEGEGHGFRQAENIRAALDGELSFYAQVLGFELPPGESIAPIEVS